MLPMTGGKDDPGVSKSRQAADRIIGQFRRSWDNYLDHWQEWIVPALIVGLIAMASIFCCGLPYLLLMGPLFCGLYHCAFEAFDNRTVRSELLNRGMETAGSSIPASLLILLLNALPILALYGGFFALMMVMVAAAGPPGPAGGPNQGEPPPELMVGMMLFYLGMFPAIFVILIWQLWISTRTMFVLPLIAHRRMGVSAAWRTSWRETKTSFWELLALNLAAQFIAGIGAYFMYVGMLFTVPFAMTLLTAVYLQRFGDGENGGDEPDGAMPEAPSPKM